MPMSPRLLRPRASATLVATDADARTYISAVRAADGGQWMEAGVQLAIDSFIIGCKADGIWSAIKASCILCGARTLAGINIPLVGSTPTFNAFTSSEYNRKTGLVGNGSTMWIDSGRNNNADPQDSKHLSVWRVTAATNDAGLIGSNGTGSGDSHIYTGFGSFIFRNNAQAVVAQLPLSSMTGAGFVGTSRSGAAVILSRVGTTDTAGTTTSQTPRSASIRVFETGGRTNARLAFYSIGENVNLALLGSRVSALVSAIGAAIP